MNSDELAKMVEMAKAYSGWEYAEYFRPEYIASVVTREDGHVESIAHCLDEQYGDFIAQAPATIVALAEQLEQMKASLTEGTTP